MNKLVYMECLYFIAVVFPEQIEKEIEELKRYVFLKYKSKASLRSPGHITLHMPFRWNESQESILNNKLLNFIADKINFEIFLNGFGAFIPRVIFINVENNPNLTTFQNQLSKFSKCELKLFESDYKNKPFHPHVTIAFRDLKKNIFSTAFEEFKNKEFSASFIADNIALLKHNGKEWEVHKKFYLLKD